MTTDEAISILETIARDEATNPTARCTALRTLIEIQEARPREDLDAERMLYAVNSPRRGRGHRRSSR